MGCRPGMISGATGAVIFVGLILELKNTFPEISTEQILQYVFAVVVLGGSIQILAGVFKLGKFIRLVPHPVMFGFVNGLAIIIFMAQFTSIVSSNEALSSFFSGTTSGLNSSLLSHLLKISRRLPNLKHSKIAST